MDGQSACDSDIPEDSLLLVKFYDGKHSSQTQIVKSRSNNKVRKYGPKAYFFFVLLEHRLLSKQAILDDRGCEGLYKTKNELTIQYLQLFWRFT